MPGGVVIPLQGHASIAEVFREVVAYASVLLAWSTVCGYGRPLHDEEDQMLKAGDEIENPVTGETITFIRTSEDTGGAHLEIELLLRPDAFLPAAHVHPAQEEAFTVLEGAVRFTSGAHVDVVRAGGKLRVPGGQPHSWGPDGDAGARVRVVFSPPGSTAQFFNTYFALARDGKVNDKGLANPIRMAQMGRTYDLYLAAAPVAAQRPVFAALDLVGRLLGYPRMPV